MFMIRVPATSANLGPGFDCAGIALSLYANFQFKPSSILAITGCDQEYAGESNLVYQSYCSVLRYYHKDIQPFSLHIDSEIPLARGLGSSAACVVAGIMAADCFYQLNLSKDDILFHATQIEGHPDNVAPAIFGGFMISMMEYQQPYTIASPVHPAYHFYVSIPDFELSTPKARAVLPQLVSFHDAIHNLSRIALTMKGLETRNDLLLSKAMKDILHEPYRSTLIPEFDDVKDIAAKHGCISSVLSGAGPTILHIASAPANIRNWQSDLANLSHNWRLLSLALDTNGAVLIEEEEYE